MKKLLVGIAVVGVIAAAVFGTNVAFAQGPDTDDSPGTGFRGRGASGRGGMGLDGDGVLHDYITPALAEALNISAADLEARLENGETAYQIALDLGFEDAQIRDLMAEVHQSALDQAVADGVIEEGQFPQGDSSFGSRGEMGFDGDGVLHDYITPALAEALNISAADLEARLENGETFYQIALDLGFENDQIRDLMADARQSAFDQAVEDGAIEEGQFPQGNPGGGRFGDSKSGGSHPRQNAGQDSE